jgi:hypothetical protein
MKAHTVLMPAWFYVALLPLLLLLLPSADYSQVELRLLAHFSGDRLLQQLLSQSGPDGDVFTLIAAAWLQQGSRGLAGRRLEDA